jgi:hypothetical protein
MTWSFSDPQHLPAEAELQVSLNSYKVKYAAAVPSRGAYRLFFKRVLDVSAIVLAAPVVIVSAIMVARVAVLLTDACR